MFNTMNTVRPRPYPQRETGNYNAGSDGADKDGHNGNAQDQQQQRQQQQTIARGRAQDIQHSSVKQYILLLQMHILQHTRKDRVTKSIPRL